MSNASISEQIFSKICSFSNNGADSENCFDDFKLIPSLPIATNFASISFSICRASFLESKIYVKLYYIFTFLNHSL